MNTVYPEEVLTTVEVCRYLKITRQALYHLIKEGRLAPWKKLGNGSTFLFLRGSLSRRSLKKPLCGGRRAGEAADDGEGAAKEAGAHAMIFLLSRDKAVAEQVYSDLKNQGHYISVAEELSRVETIFKAGEIPEVVVLDLDPAAASAGRAASAGERPGSVPDWGLFAEVKRLARESRLPPPAYILLFGRHTASQEPVKAFKSGAWDFLKKPVDPGVFTARVQLALRRRFWSELDTGSRGCVLASHDGRIVLDSSRRILELRGPVKQPVFRRLTRKETELLRLFLKRPGMMFSKAVLLEVAWGYTVDIMTRTVDCHIKNLRRKLRPYGGRIETHYSQGYRFRDSDKTGPADNPR